MVNQDSFTAFADFSPESRVWIFPFENALDEGQKEALLGELADFVSAWKAHGAKVKGGVAVFHSHFAVFCADPTACDVSGCSIDSMFHAVDDAAKKVGATLVDPNIVFYLEDASVRAVNRPAFRELARSERINAETPVFDHTIESLADLRGGWVKAAKSSWHQKLLS